jgi:ABC-type lipoprotein release transport system permease subunit
MKAPRLIPLFLLLCGFLLCTAEETAAVDGNRLRASVESLSTFPSRLTGSPGYEQAAQLIEGRLAALGLAPQSHLFQLPVRIARDVSLTVDGIDFPLSPYFNNAISPGGIDGPLEAPLYYLKAGNLDDIAGYDLVDSIVLLDFDSGRNWQLLASLGARAIIFLGDDNSHNRIYFQEKFELTPLQVPCFWMQPADGKAILRHLKLRVAPPPARAELRAQASWENRLARNIYALIPGSDPELEDQLLIVEAFFDNEELVVGQAPGADAASGIATLLELAVNLSQNPLGRSVLLQASSGQAQSLAGMREAVWSINSRPRELRDRDRQLQEIISQIERQLAILNNLNFPLAADQGRDALLAEAIRQTLGERVDAISRELIALRLGEQTVTAREETKQTAKQRLLYRSLGWAENFHDLTAQESEMLQGLIPAAISRTERILANAERERLLLRSATDFRNTVRDYEITALISLHLSSHGNGIGGFHRGWLYNLKPSINRTSAYAPVAELFEKTAGEPIGRAAYQDTLRPSHLRSWDSWFFDQPALGGEVSALAGYLGLSLVTTGDGRSVWGTPTDRSERVDWQYLTDQAQLVERLIRGLGAAPDLHGGGLPRDGFASVTGRTNLLLQGELFASFPAAGATILAYQGMSRFHAMVDEFGYFQIRGIADRKHVFDKLIIEGYRFDEENSRVVWAIDKKQTGKDNYRLRPFRKYLQTDLVMFHSRETTLFDVLEPRNFSYMTKLQLYDGRRDAPPERYWFSRIDTRDSIISSIYTEPGTLLKLTMSDTVLTNKLVLTNGTTERPLGLGYPVNDTPRLINTIHHAAADAWTLLVPRIEHLENHGIYDEKISSLQERGQAALSRAGEARAHFDHATVRAASAEALALAARVYVQVEKTQKDVLLGVLFYIALFVPFAFVMERFLFNYANIYKRIVAFSLILLLQIAIIYSVHPAFALAYSPMVVILAFFIIGLSFLVTLIIFFRFEDEMVLLQRRASHKRPQEMSRWKAFSAAFFLGVSNLRRRRIRSILTATTLIILTFTIMSFTTIKSSNQQVRLPFQSEAPYQGLLLKKMSRLSLPPQATDILVNSMAAISRSAPRIWLEGIDPSRPVNVPLRHGDQEIEIQGLIGLSPDEAAVTGLDRILTSGRWFNDDDRQAIILEEEMARRLGIPSGREVAITLWGTPFTVIATFRAEDFERAIDLDGEPLTPVIFPEEAGKEISEEEMEALESGDDVRSFQSRYSHIPASQTAIIPARTLLAAGGKLKNVAVRPTVDADIAAIASQLSDRFNLAIFTGEKDGVWLYNVSDTMNYSGVPNIIIPLLISVLIVLNTMISSVYERKGEIAVYTSVGLAPSHVGFLFVAEALALGVVSAVLGYLVAQVSAALLAETPLWAGITVNYSSTAGVAAMLLVVTVVLLSVLYPARVAARIAMPDVNRTFTLPAPVDNRIEVTLPFLLKFREHGSIGGYLYNYLSSHRDISHGLFSTGPVDIVFSCSTTEEISAMVKDSVNPHDVQCLHLRAKVWLAPFDFGIMQTMDIHFFPSPAGEDFLEIRISMHRQSGESGAWLRINTAFFHELRKQLLIWRSLDEFGHEELQHSFFRRVAGVDTATGSA